MQRLRDHVAKQHSEQSPETAEGKDVPVVCLLFGLTPWSLLAKLSMRTNARYCTSLLMILIPRLNMLNHQECWPVVRWSAEQPCYQLCSDSSTVPPPLRILKKIKARTARGVLALSVLQNLSDQGSCSRPKNKRRSWIFAVDRVHGQRNHRAYYFWSGLRLPNDPSRATKPCQRMMAE